ncbi:MAG: bifunctional demethylmenaquinone methyltransferase/2-methoxy-6-polyprenyl-1,4-benzoquinol methylase UbiE [Actinomycetota bacterium]|nr:bifunctional demethylmenaquinone methyltransferase/2-methoxy-6-polyprenyl-1,4-benzoquinol methylase UbiE [Actinomycetota bacterium]
MSDSRGGPPGEQNGQTLGERLPSGEERARLVREMFDRIAGRYELLNTVMTAGMHRIWNKKLVEATGLQRNGRALDLACGTGSLTRDLAKKVGPGGYVLGIDFSPKMLTVAEARSRHNVEYRLGDATNLQGVSQESFDAATIAYGARNIPDLDALFSEMARVVAPGGTVVCLEIARPSGRLSSAFYGLWFDKIVPWLGAKVSGDSWAYSYLPQSVKEFVAPDELADIMRRNGLQNVTWQRLAGGIITLHRGRKRSGAGSL